MAREHGSDVEESTLPYEMGLKAASFKAQTRFWGYHANQNNPGSVFASLFAGAPGAVDHPRKIWTNRRWKRCDRGRNVVSRMDKAALLSPPGDVDKIFAEGEAAV